LLPPSLDELELLPVTVDPPAWVGWAAVVELVVGAVVEEDVVEEDVEEEVVEEEVVVALEVPAAALWLRPKAATPNRVATPATVEPTATRIRVVRDRCGDVMGPTVGAGAVTAVSGVCGGSVSVTAAGRRIHARCGPGPRSGPCGPDRP
jgi:hypothetical protein